jgi:hypothetical protein
MIYKYQAFSTSYFLAPPPPPPPSRQQVVSLSKLSPVEFSDVRVGKGGGGGANSYDDSLVLYKSSITHCAQWYTDKKEKKIFLLYKEIQKGSGAKSYMTNDLLQD